LKTQEKLRHVREEHAAACHVIIEAGVIPGISYPCRCMECRTVAIRMDEAGYLDNVKDRWWEEGRI
jgi:hypothetical protein